MRHDRSPSLAPAVRVLLALSVLPAFAVAQDAVSDRFAGTHCLDRSLAMRSPELQRALCVQLRRDELPGVDLSGAADLDDLLARLG